MVSLCEEYLQKKGVIIYFFFMKKSVSLSFFCSAFLIANPSDPIVTEGSATFTQYNAKVFEIQASDRTIIEWKDFSIGKDETTRFVQPSMNSSVLNRVTDSPSQIFGQLEANGQVYLINPNGIVFGEHSSVNTASFIASTLDIHDQAFLDNEEIAFSGDSKHPIVHYGSIVSEEGHVLFVGYTIDSTGTIEAKNGEVGLISREKVFVKLKDHVYIRTQCSENWASLYEAASSQCFADDALEFDGENLTPSKVTVQGQIKAQRESEGGKIYLLGDWIEVSHHAALDVSHPQDGGEIFIGGEMAGKTERLNNAKRIYIDETSLLSANCLNEGKGGNIILWSDESTQFFGKIEAQGGTYSGDGGFAEISSKEHFDHRGEVNLLASNGKAGTLLLDPLDLTIDGADFNVTAATPFVPTGAGAILSTATLTGAGGLGGANTIVRTTGTVGGQPGDININATFTWATGFDLLIDAAGAINQAVAAAVFATGAGANITFQSVTGMTIRSSVRNDDAVTGGNVSLLCTNGDINMGANVPVHVGSLIGTVFVEATRGNLNMTAGTTPGDHCFIGYGVGAISPATVASGDVTVNVGGTLSMRSGAGTNQASITKNNPLDPGRNINASNTTVNVGVDLFCLADTFNGAGSGIGRPQQLLGSTADFRGNITVNVGRDIYLLGGDNFSVIGARTIPNPGGFLESIITINTGRNFIIAHDLANTFPNSDSGGQIGGNRSDFGINPSGPISLDTRLALRVNVGGNFVMDGRGGPQFATIANDGTLAAIPPESLIHVNGDLLMIGGNAAVGNTDKTVGLEIIDTINPSIEYFVRGSIVAVNGFDPNVNALSGIAHLHVNGISAASPAATSRDIGTVRVLAGGDIRSAGSGRNRFNVVTNRYDASGGITYISDFGFAAGQLWPAMSVLVGGTNIFAGTPLAGASLPTVSNGLGAITFDPNYYNTNTFPGNFNQLAFFGASGANPLNLGALGMAMTMSAQDGSDIFVQSQDLFASGAPADITNIGVLDPSVQFSNALDPVTPFTSNGADITVIGFRDTYIRGNPAGVPPPPIVEADTAIYAPTGSILVITQRDMFLENSAVVAASFTVDLVVDNQAPFPPLIGDGSFHMDGTSFISSDFNYIRVYTAQQQLNTIDPAATFLSAGVPFFFLPGALFVDTDQEKWCTYYPNGDQGIPFKIFYKPCIEEIAEEAQIVVGEFLRNENFFPYRLGWPETFKIKYADNLHRPWHIFMKEPYFIPRPNDIPARNNPKTWKELME